MGVLIPIISEFDAKGINKAIKRFEQLETTGEKAQFALQKAALPAIAALGALAVAGGVAVKAASDLAETQNKVAVVFGEASDEVLKFSESSAKALGQSRTEALAAASSFGTFGKAAGLAGKDLATFSTDFVALASDLASFNNTSPQDAINAIGSALRGEAEPLRRYGVLLNDASLRQAALSLGIYDGSGALTAQQKVLAAQKLIYDSTGDAQGDFARTSDGLANQSRILKATLADTTAQLGTALLPAVQAVLPYFVRLAEFASKNTEFITAMAIGIGILAVSILAANAALRVYNILSAITIAINKSMTTSFTTMNVAMNGSLIAMAAFAVATKASTDSGRKELGMLAILGPVVSSVANLYKQLTNDTKAVALVTDGATDSQREYTASLRAGKDAAFAATIAVTGLARAVSQTIRITEASDAAWLKSWDVIKTGTKEAVGGAATAVESFAKALKVGLNAELTDAKAALKDAEDAFNSFAASVAASVRAGLNFGAAFQLMTTASKDAASASEDVAKARDDLAKAIAGGDIEDVTKAQLALTAAQKADTAAALENKNTFMDRIAAQVQGVKDYAANLKTLLTRGLSQDALQLVLDSGAEAGAAIATELVNGTTEMITGPEGLNALVESANTAANEVGIQAAGKWYQAGKDSAKQMVDGIEAALIRMTPKLMAHMDAIAAKMKRTVDISVRVTEKVSRIVTTIEGGGIPKLAQGGIVNSPTLALIGERGPEAVIPLNRAGGMGTTININGVITEQAAGQAIVNALKRYNQTTGPISIQVAA